MRSQFGYSHWKKEHRFVLETLPGKDVFMFFSGGKDSSMAMDFMLRAGKDFGFDFTAHAGAFPVHRYTDSEKLRIGSYWHERGVNIIWHLFEETDDIIRQAENPCLSCQKIRKRMLGALVSRAAHDLENLVLVTSYSLWDIVSYSMEHILGEMFSCSEKGAGSGKSNRFVETSQRFYPFFRMKEGYTVFRPLVRYNNSDIQALIESEGIPTLSIPCDFSESRPKRILEKYYEKMEARFDYDRVFAFAKSALDLPDISSYTNLEMKEYLLDIF